MENYLFICRYDESGCGDEVERFRDLHKRYLLSRRVISHTKEQFE